jgi:predicted transcriptional regulator
MDLPSHLRALPPSAIDVMRYLNKLDLRKAGVEDICEEVGLSERGFGKAIRSLVTKGYVIMDDNQIYRLTDQGGRVADEIAEYFPDEDDLDAADGGVDGQLVTRRLILLLPRSLYAEQPVPVVVGIGPQPAQTSPAEVVVRLSLINGEPAAPQEAAFQVTQAAVTQDFLVTPGHYNQMRLKVEVYQLGPNPEDIVVAGGMYVDCEVQPAAADVADAERVAYGADVTLLIQD